jgi:hypothetical protein
MFFWLCKYSHSNSAKMKYVAKLIYTTFIAIHHSLSYCYDLKLPIFETDKTAEISSIITSSSMVEGI